MLMEAVRWLRESGLKVEDSTAADEADAGADAVLDVAADGHSTRFAVQVSGGRRIRTRWSGLNDHGVNWPGKDTR